MWAKVFTKTQRLSYCKTGEIMKVLKFGGKSLENVDKLIDVCKYIKQVSKNEKVVVVVSAMGDTTDSLIEKSKEVAPQNPCLRELDVLLSTGETQCASMVSLCLNYMSVKAVSMQGWQIELYTMGKAGESVVTAINKSKIGQMLNKFDVVVVAGFQGINKQGDVTTLGRGGSDTTAVALGAVLNCEVEIFSNFDGIFVGDPKDLRYKKLKEISYQNMLMLSNGEAKVLSSSSADIAMQSSVDVVCKQSTCPNESGTHLCSLPQPIISLICKDNLCEINILCSRMENNLQKTAKYIINNVKYYKFCAKNNQLTILIDKKEKQNVLRKIAKLNNLLEVKHGD